MKYICIGKIVNTHGIKGEVRLLSDFKYKKQVFKPNFKIYIGQNKEEQIIKTYRVHKIFDMITLIGIDNINDVLKYKTKKVYINKDDLNIDGYLNEDLIGLKVYQNKKDIGTIVDIMKNNKDGILVIKNETKTNLVPNLPEFIEKVDLENKKMQIKYLEGLIDED